MYDFSGQSRQMTEEKALCHTEQNTIISSLQTVLTGDTIVSEGLEDILKAALEEAAMKKQKILSTYRIRETARGWYIRDKRIDHGKKHEFRQRSDLENYILKCERGWQEESVVTIEKIFDGFASWRRTTSAAETLAKDKRYYRDYFQKSPIVRTDITHLTKLSITAEMWEWM